MVTKESFMERLMALAEEYEQDRKLRPNEWIKKRLLWEDWETLMPEAVELAKGELKRRLGGRARVLPGGYDAESVAGEAVADLLAGKRQIAPGWTRERLMRQLGRVIRGKIRALELRKETAVTRGEWEMNGEGEQVSVLAGVRDHGKDASELAMAREEEARRQRLKGEVREGLSGEPELAAIFECWSEGIRNPAAIAQRLGMKERAVVAAGRRLERRLRGFGKGGPRVRGRRGNNQ
jgi:hypothetical protein